MTLRPHINISFILTLLLSSIVSTAAVSTLKAGSSLSTSDPPLQSPSGDFSFGFHLRSDGNTYLPSIWYTNISDTIVWYTTTSEDGVVAPKGSTLTATSFGGLVLVDPQGHQLWLPQLYSGTPDHCVLNDTGNLMILSSDGQTLWQSFDHPRDTLLPTQTMSNEGAIVSSLRAESNFTRGRFMMMIQNGDLLLKTRNINTNTTYDFMSYYNSNTNNQVETLGFNNSGHMYLLDINGSKLVDLTEEIPVPTPEEDYFFRATLNFDGVFILYYHEKSTTTTTGNSSSWSVLKSIPNDICYDVLWNLTSGACGYNSICSLGSNSRPKCQCPTGYSLTDPNDEYGDCTPDFEMYDCYDQQQSRGQYSLKRLPLTDFPGSDYDFVNNVNAEDDCMALCMEDCFCAVAFLREGYCWKKRWPLSTGRQGNPDTGTAFIKVRNDNSTSTAGNVSVPVSRKRPAPVIYALLGTFGFLIVVLFSIIGLVISYFYREQMKRGYNIVVNSYKHNGGFNSVRCFTYKELEEATDGFREELGRGACAIVYKGSGSGIIPDGVDMSFIAVKRIDRSSLGEAEKELKAEANIIGQTHHRNLVKMIGYCVENEHRMLVYEFMSNGSLANFLFGETRPQWSVRIDIAKEIASGLVYLHEECSTQIIHCDIKPQNILLDELYRPRISDFGLSKLLKLNQFQTQTAIRGTKGYVAPEWFKNKLVDVKVDVYSYGVLLLEIVCCRRCIDHRSNIDPQMAILSDYAIYCYELKELAALVGEDEETLHDMENVERFVKVAIWCIQEDPKTRPTMRQISHMLEGLIVVPDPPCRPPDSFSTSFK